MRRNTKIVTMLICFLICVVTLTAAIGTTLAFYTGGGDLKNNLATKDSSLYLEEEFNPDDKWLPGETKEKVVNFKNSGKSDQVIRFKVELQWLNKSDGTWVPATTDPVKINWHTSLGTDWDDSFVADVSDKGWYYYNKILAVGEATPAVMNSVTFSPKLANAVIGDSKDDFSGTTYRIKVYMEGVDVSSDITTITWGKAFVKGSGDSLTWSAATP
jgi:hypothetical protein